MNEGHIELESGPWDWRIADLEGQAGGYVAGARPAGEADPDAARDTGPRSVLLLEKPGEPDSWMIKDLPPGAADEDVSEDRVLDLARDANRRQIVDGDGKVWRLDAIPDPEAVREEADYERGAHEIRATSDGGPERIVPLPGNHRLGTMSRDELLGIIAG